jgi:hypothetical protein
MNPAKRLKVDSTFGGGERLHGEQEVELELEQVADFLKVSRRLNENFSRVPHLIKSF